MTCGKLAHCLDASNGNLVWKTKIKAKYCYLQIIPEGLVIGGNGYVQLLDTKSGSVIYITSLTGGGYTITSIAVVNDTIYASNSGTIYAVDRKSGKVLFEISTTYFFLVTSLESKIGSFYGCKHSYISR